MVQTFWGALGVAEPPSAFALRLMDDARLESFVGGRVSETGIEPVPVPGGLYDEHIFGMLPRENGEVLWTRTGGEGRDKPQGVRFGHIRLPVPVVHPFAHRITGEQRPLLQRILRGELAVRGEDGTVVEDPEDFDGMLVYGQAVEALNAARALPIAPGELLCRLPVLPAGLRPSVRVEGRFRIHDLTYLYRLLLNQVARYERLVELHAPPLILANEIGLLQGAVDGLILTGFAERREGGDEKPRLVPAEPGDPIAIPSIAQVLQRNPDWADVVDRLVSEGPPDVFSQRWYTPAYEFRAFLEAMALEPVPLDGEGRVDEAKLARAGTHRLARLVSDVYEQLLGPLHDRDLHDDSGLTPHIDVFATEPRDGRRYVMTGGMSGAPMPDDPRYGPNLLPHVELVMAIPGDTSIEMVHHAMRVLSAIARYPFQRDTFYAPGQDIALGRPIAPGSPLDGYILCEAPSVPPWSDLPFGLPRTPAFLFVVGSTADQRAALSRSEERFEALAAFVRQTNRLTAWPVDPPPGAGRAD